MSESVSSAAFRESLSQFASGVTIVTARTPEGPVGFTATAFTSVSLEPPLVLVCIAKTASVHDAIVAASEVGINVLAEGQGWIAMQFAQRGIDRFRGVSVRPAEGPPLLEGALVNLVGNPRSCTEAGDHVLLLLEVTHTSIAPGEPLVHFSRTLGGFTRPARAEE